MVNTCNITDENDVCVIYNLFGGSLNYLNKVCQLDKAYDTNSIHRDQLYNFFAQTIKRTTQNFDIGNHKHFFRTAGMAEAAKLILEGKNDINMFDMETKDTLMSHSNVIIRNDNKERYEFVDRVFEWFLLMTFDKMSIEDVLDEAISHC